MAQTLGKLSTSFHVLTSALLNKWVYLLFHCFLCPDQALSTRCIPIPVHFLTFFQTWLLAFFSVLTGPTWPWGRFLPSQPPSRSLPPHGSIFFSLAARFFYPFSPFFFFCSWLPFRLQLGFSVSPQHQYTQSHLSEWVHWVLIHFFFVLTVPEPTLTGLLFFWHQPSSPSLITSPNLLLPPVSAPDVLFSCVLSHLPHSLEVMTITAVPIPIAMPPNLSSSLPVLSQWVPLFWAVFLTSLPLTPYEPTPTVPMPLTSPSLAMFISTMPVPIVSIDFPPSPSGWVPWSHPLPCAMLLPPSLTAQFTRPMPVFPCSSPLHLHHAHVHLDNWPPHTHRYVPHLPCPQLNTDTPLLHHFDIIHHLQMLIPPTTDIVRILSSSLHLFLNRSGSKHLHMHMDLGFTIHSHPTAHALHGPRPMPPMVSVCMAFGQHTSWFGYIVPISFFLCCWPEFFFHFLTDFNNCDPNQQCTAMLDHAENAWCQWDSLTSPSAASFVNTSSHTTLYKYGFVFTEYKWIFFFGFTLSLSC